MAQQLLNRERVLLAWPHGTQDTEFWRRPSAAVGAAVLKAFAVGLGAARGYAWHEKPVRHASHRPEQAQNQI